MVHRGPLCPQRLRMSKFGGSFQKHKNSDNSKGIDSSNSKFSQNVPTLCMHHPAKFQPPTPSGSEVTAKCSFLTHFKTLAQIPLYCAKYWVICICHMSERDTHTNFLSRPSYEHRYSFQLLNLRETQNLVHFKTLILVSLQHNGRQTASISATQV